MWTWGDRSLWQSLKEVYLYWWRWYCLGIIFVSIGTYYGLPFAATVFWVCIFTLMHQSPPVTIYNVYSYGRIFFFISCISFFFWHKPFIISVIIFFLCFATMDRETSF